ncbi:hypothetical protein [Brochothrix thermosphacta]|uniref:Uncharacterized protein n=1 Tax=Brochothrix thermosphacta TaxID=2756 RepID=A0A2X0QXF4_BROTH|nr:hypothetical protein [Brochothrix thermosphacta]SPP28858.1 conserved hypothetical protein [Brochothrix thermosphacta]
MTELILKQVILYVSEVVLISFLCYLAVDATHKIKRLIKGEIYD